MAACFVNIDRETTLLLPPDLRDRVPTDHLVQFVLDAVSLLDLSTARIKHRGTGDAQYPPATMLALLIYSYATGTFISRQIERSTRQGRQAYDLRKLTPVGVQWSGDGATR